MAQKEYVVDQGLVLSAAEAEVAAVNGVDTAPEAAPPLVQSAAEAAPPAQVFRCDAAGFRAARMTIAAFTELSTTFTQQVAYQTALDLTKTVLASPSGAKILEE